MTDAQNRDALPDALFSPVKLFGRRSSLLSGEEPDQTEHQDPVHIDFQAGVFENDDAFGMRLRLEWRDQDAQYAIEVGQQVVGVLTAELSSDSKVDLLANYVYPHLLGYATAWMGDEANVLGLEPPAFEVESYMSLREGFIPHVRSAFGE